MGKYTTKQNILEENNTEVIDVKSIEEEFADVHDISFPYEPTMEGAEAINAFMEEEYLELVEHQGFMELAYFEKNKVEMPFEESFIKEGGFIDRAIKFFQSIKEKIKVLFDKFLAMLMGFFAKDKAFIKMYGEKIKKSNAHVEFKGYNFKFDDSVQKVFTRVSSFIKSTEESISGDVIRGKLLGKESLSASEYSDELFKLFRSGAKEKEDVKYSPDEIIKQLLSSEHAKKAVLIHYNMIKSAIDNLISKANDLKKNGEKSAPKTIDTLKIILSSIQTYTGAFLTALKARNIQNKAIAVKLVTASKESKNESYEFDGNLSFV